MSAKAKGTRREHASKRLLEAAGYSVLRAAGSHGAWDLIGISLSGVVLVQVKSGRWPGAAEMAALLAFPCPPGCTRLVHRWQDRARLPDVREL